MAPIQFWFDFASTYSYVAALRIEDVTRARGIPLVWRPFLLGPIFERQGWSDSPYNLNPVRGAYMWRDVARQCARHGIPFVKPSRFPRNSVLPGRVACLAAEQGWLPEFARSVFHANFADDHEISEVPVIAGILASLGRDPAAVLADAVSPGNKGRLRRETDAAWALGIFGAPTFVVDGELFWGNDRLEEALDWRARG